MNKTPKLWMIIPCYNEKEVLSVTAPLFLEQLGKMAAAGKISAESRVLFVDDGSDDGTWDFITALSKRDKRCVGIRQSRNRGHQNALLAGLMEAKEQCDLTISVDCDGQDDISAMDRMVDEYLGGCEIVYGVRSDRDSDTWFKRTTARGFYGFLNSMGAEVIRDHADYRLVSSRVLRHFADFTEVNIYLRGMFPLVGFKSTSVYYKRNERIAGKSHYSLKKMVSLAFDGITGLSLMPITVIAVTGAAVCAAGLIGMIASAVMAARSIPAAGRACVISVVCLVGGLQILSTGIVGQYTGRAYMETKRRPRYIISEKTWDDPGSEPGDTQDGKDDQF